MTHASPTPRRKRPGWISLLFGVLFPAFVIGFELLTRMCAQAFFNPMPSIAGGLLVSAVPSVNLALWLRLRRPEPLQSGRWLLAGGAAAAVAACYALIFVPLYPLAAVAVLYFGLGLLPFGPAAACIVAVTLTRKAGRSLARTQPPRSGRTALAGVLLGLVTLTLTDLPSAATRLALSWSASPEAEDQQRGLRTMQAIGDRALLLRLCYDNAGQPSGLLSLLASGGDGVDSGQARELYYRVTGRAFNAVPPPYDGGAWSFTREFAFDQDQGGAQVGGRLRDLHLASSRIDGSVANADGAAYLEWTFEVRNTGQQAKEARFQLQPPPGGVVTRATLWVNGEPREAVFAGRGAARAAYEQVVVVQRRDPLLVTGGPGGRVLVQAFPVLPGETMKFRLGLTVPLQGSGPDTGRLTLPAIVDRNFTIDDSLRHAVWIEGDGPLSADRALFRADAGAEAARLRADLTDVRLSAERPSIVAASPRRHAYAPARSVPISSLMVVVDGSVALRQHAGALREALERIPPGAPVGLVLAREELRTLPPAPWSPERRRAFEQALGARRFLGGQDNAGALAEALEAAGPGGAVLWVHGPQPVRFAAGAARLDQTVERLGPPARLIDYAVVPGPDETTPDAPWGWTAQRLPGTGEVGRDLGDALAALLTPAPRWTPSVEGAPSPHQARLAGYAEVLALLADGGPAGRARAEAVAARLRLVTPVSGAIVLETDADYTRAGLQPPGAAEVPTVPEPSEWALLGLAAAVLAWTLHRRRRGALA